MRLRRALRVAGEAARAAASARASSAIVAAIVGVCVLSIVLTTGQSAAAERRVLDRIDEAGTRFVTLEQQSGAPPLPAHAVDVIARLSRVEWAIGLTVARDGRNVALGAGGQPAAFRTVVGTLPADVRVPERQPAPGEALVPAPLAAQLGLRDRAGAVQLIDGQQVPVVGTFEAGGAVGFLADAGLVVAGRPAPDVHRIHLLVDDIDAVGGVAAAALGVLAPQRPGDISVGTAQALADLQRLVEGDLRASGRDLLAGVLAAGALLIGATTTAQTVLRRRDLGRRRALGATRGTVVALLILQTAYPAVVGSLAGIGGGLVAAHLAGLEFPPPSFLAGAATLAALVATVAAVLPAVAAARRDPLAVLRTP